MVLQSRKEELLTAWRALSGQMNENGWNTIPISTKAPCRILAGRHFPGNEEALLFGFSAIKVPPADQLPQGHGFVVFRVEPREDLGRQYVWVALCCQNAVSLDLFVTMADDLILTLNGLNHMNDEGLFHVFLARIRAWQSLMHHEKNGFLTSEEEIGLFGELELLRELLSSGLPAKIAIDGWEGPQEGVHDFRLGNGAIEVKTTLSSIGFPAKINSLEQLDETLVQPLFLAGIRLALHGSGITLPEQIDCLRDILSKTPEALVMFNSSLLNVGFLEDASDSYSRRFLVTEKRTMQIFAEFPRLTCSNVKIEIRKAKYELDLDMVTGCDVDFIKALSQLKVM